MRKFRDLVEAKETIVFAFGRFNPPTTGHEKLIQKTALVAGSNPYRIYPSFTQNPKKDPLPHSTKAAYMRKMFKKYAKNIVVDNNAKTAIMIAEKLYKEGYKNLVMVAGSDRVKEFSALLNKYNDAPDKKGNQLFKFDSVNVVSAGERDPDSEGVEGMSASKMRAAAADGDFDSFSQGVPSGFADGKKLYRDVRKHMGVREERDMGNMTDFETLRDAYLTGKIWNVGDIVEANGAVGEIVRKGTNYLSFMDEDGKVHKAWLHEINEGVKDLPPHLQKLVKQLDKKEKELEKKGLKVKTFIYNPDTGKPDIELGERNYAKEYQNYHSRPEQIERRSSRNKARRVMGDRTKIGMDVGHIDNDPMNNDPSNLGNEDPSDNRREPRLREDSINEVGRSRPRAGGPKSIERNIKKHIELMNKYIKQGMSKEEASKKAYKEIVKEEVELDEVWWDKAIAKLNQVSHPKEYGKMVKQYAELMRQEKYKKRPNMAADQVAREYSGVSVREFIKYINTLVAKKVLPQELKAEYEGEDNMFTFREFVDEMQEEPAMTKKQAAVSFGGGPEIGLQKKPDVVPKTAPTPKAEIKPSAPEKKDTQSFGQAFATARKEAGGPSGTFSWKGKKYNTRRADDPKPSKSKPVSPKKTIVPKSTAPVPSMPKVPVGKVEAKPLAPPAKAKHDVSTKAGRQSWYNARVEKARKAGHPNPNMYASQAALESGWGKSKSAKGNIVGMKARKGQAGETKGTSEYVKGKKVKTTGRFAEFGSEAGGIKQHGKEWKGGLTKSGGRKYATDPDYEKKIAAISKGYGSVTASFDADENKEMTFKDFVNQIQKGPIKEVLAKGADVGDYIDDFAKSDAPQFKGKSKEKRKEMAIAAYYAKNES